MILTINWRISITSKFLPCLTSRVMILLKEVIWFHSAQSLVFCEGQTMTRHYLPRPLRPLAESLISASDWAGSLLIRSSWKRQFRRNENSRRQRWRSRALLTWRIIGTISFSGMIRKRSKQASELSHCITEQGDEWQVIQYSVIHSRTHEDGLNLKWLPPADSSILHILFSLLCLLYYFCLYMSLLLWLSEKLWVDQWK